MKRLTIIIGAGSVTEISDVTTSSITNKLLNSDTINITSKELFNKIYNDLLMNNTNFPDYRPNFEDIFHGMEVLASLYTTDTVIPEYKPIYKYFTNIKEDYLKYNNPITTAFQDLLNTIVESIESYSNKFVEDWFKNFFLQLHNHYKLDIFSLNYDNCLEKIFRNYNDGFEDTPQSNVYDEFNPKKAIDISNYHVNINHLHGQIDFSFDKIQEFQTDELFTIYKSKNHENDNILRFPYGSSRNTQSGEHIKQTTIITGKNKTEKIISSPFDTYRTNLQQCISNNPNLLIIGYGFADYYINGILKQFNKIHQENKRVNIIDQIDDEKWNDSIHTRQQVSETKYRTLNGILGNNIMDEMLSKRFESPQIFNNGTTCLYFKGFHDAVKNNSDDIIRLYND